MVAFIESFVIDKVFLGGEKAFIAHIYSKNSDEINKQVIEVLHLGGVGEIGMVFPVVQNGQGHTGHIPVAALLLRKIAAGIGNDLIVHNIHTPKWLA